MLATLVWYVLLLTPNTLLALAGVLLWWRTHTPSTSLSALGFVISLLCQIALAWDGARISTYLSTKDYTFVTTHYHPLGAWIHQFEIVGFWVGSAGLVWFAIRTRRVSVS